MVFSVDGEAKGRKYNGWGREEDVLGKELVEGEIRGPNGTIRRAIDHT
jgi:hypothetical protein